MGPLQDAIAEAQRQAQAAAEEQARQQAEFERQYQEVLARQQNATYNRAY